MRAEEVFGGSGGTVFDEVGKSRCSSMCLWFVIDAGRTF